MDENKQGNCYRSFLFPTKGHVFFQNCGVHRKMSVENATKKLKRVTRENEAQRLDHI